VRPTFLTLDEVLALHAWQITSYGGTPGIRELGLLESALAVPQSTFDGAFLHATVHEMAAAYLFHIAQNHPFIDGNKRVALAAALVFLWLNGFEVKASEDAVVKLTVGVAAGRLSKAEVAVFFKSRARERR
jgi:death-on-curing protein